MFRNRTVVFAATIWLHCAAHLAVADESSLRARFLSEGPAGWDRWAKNLSQVDAHISYKQTGIESDGSEAVYFEGDFHYFYNGNMRRRHLTKALADGRMYEEVALRRADEYLFYADRFGSNPLVLTELHGGKRKADERTVPPELQSPFSIEYVDLRSLVKDPRFTLSSLREVPEADVLVHVDFTYQCDDDAAARLKSGWAEFAPADDWALRQYRVWTPIGSDVGQSVKYGQRANGKQSLVSVRKDQFGEGGKPAVTDLWKFQHCEYREIPEDFFSFEAVGLPKMNVNGNPRRYYWVLILNVGVIFIAVGIWLRMRSRKRTA